MTQIKIRLSARSAVLPESQYKLTGCNSEPSLVSEHRANEAQEDTEGGMNMKPPAMSLPAACWWRCRHCWLRACCATVRRLLGECHGWPAVPVRQQGSRDARSWVPPRSVFHIPFRRKFASNGWAKDQRPFTRIIPTALQLLKPFYFPIRFPSFKLR